MFKWFRKKNDDPESQALNNEAGEPAETEGFCSDDGESGPEESAESGELSANTEAEAAPTANPEPEAAPAEESLGSPEPQVVPAEVTAVFAPDQTDRDDAIDGEVTGDPDEIPSDAGEEEASPEPKRKGFFARLFGEKTAVEEVSDEEADTADVNAYMETIEAEDELAESAETVADEVDTTEVSPAWEESGETVDAPDEEPALAAEAEAVAPHAPAEEDAEAQPEEAVVDEAPEDAEVTAFTEEREAVEETFPTEGDEATPRKGIFSKFKEKLSATRDRLAGRIETLLASVRTIDDDVLDELEELLITADLGTTTTADLLFKIRGQVAGNELSDAEALKDALKKRIGEMMDVPLKPFPKVAPLVIMVVGINGVGKTTTIAKLTKRLQGEGKKVLLAAGDTFRSAAVEQLTIWAERLGADIVAQPTGSDPSAVVFDALSAAQARGSDVVLIDTAGRLHTKVNLMDELKKIKRVAGKAMPGAPHHTILVLDGNTGQNALRQAQTFHEAVGVDSIIMTKLDGTAKGGVIVSIANELKIPITHVGLGESFDDLQPFDAEAFTEAILSV